MDDEYDRDVSSRAWERAGVSDVEILLVRGRSARGWFIDVQWATEFQRSREVRVTPSAWTSFAALVIVAGGCIGEGARRSAAPTTESSTATVVDTTAAALLIVGESTYFASRYDSARSVLERALGAAGGSGDSLSYARALTWLGLTAWRQGRYEDARRLGEAALAVKERHGMREDLFRSYNALGLLAHNEGRLSDAVTLFGRALEAARAAGDSASMAKAVANSGLAYFDMGDFARAQQGFRTLRESAVASGDARAEATALTNLALVDIRLGDPHAAIGSLNHSLALYRGVEYPAGEENALGQLGTAYAGAGDPHRGLAYLDSALRVARAHDLRQPESEDLQLLAGLYSEMGEHRRALEHLGRARILSSGLGQTGELGDVARAEAAAYAALGRDDLARARAVEALTLHRASGSQMEALLDQLALAEIGQRAGNARQAERALAEATALTRRLDVSVARGYLALGRARVADQRGNSSGVQRALRDGRSDIARLGPAAEGEALALQARAHARVGQLEEAVEAGRAAVASLEMVRGRIASGPLRVSFTADRAGVYGDLVLTLLRLGRADEAFEVADAARSRALLEHVAAAHGGPRSPTRDFAESERLLRRIDWLFERLREVDTIPDRERSARDYAQVTGLAQMLASARREYEAALHTAVRRDSAGAAFLGGGSVDVGALQRSLAPHEALLQFFVASNKLVTFVLTRTSIHPLEAEIGASDVGTRARLAQDVASARGGAADGKAPLRGLHDLLIAPVEASGLLSGVRTLVIVPHGSLVHVPFSALVSARGRYLVEDYSLLTLSSAAALVATRRPRTGGTGPVSVFAPFPNRLPATRAEAMAVSRIMRNTSRTIGAGANEAMVRRALARPGTVHLASHGTLDELSPMFSGIELATARERQPSDDGRLEVHELLAMSVRSELVFLSGCETAAGVAWSNSFRRGEDYATLAQAFLYAGARNVVATLWRIDDRGAAVFAERFYGELSSRSPVEALAAAQRAMIRHPKYSAPRYWAAYTLTGDGRSAVPQKRRPLTVQSRNGVPTIHVSRVTR